MVSLRSLVLQVLAVIPLIVQIAGVAVVHRIANANPNIILEARQTDYQLHNCSSDRFILGSTQAAFALAIATKSDQTGSASMVVTASN